MKKQTRKMLGDISLVMQFAEKSGMNPVEVVECFQDTFWKEITPGEFSLRLKTFADIAEWFLAPI